MAERGCNGQNFGDLHRGPNLAILSEERWGTFAADTA